MCFSIRQFNYCGFIIKINQKAIETVNNFKYLGVILDSHLKCDMHVKRLCRTIRTNLNCFYMIRPYISLKAAKLYMHAMVFSHLSYCVTVWSQVSQLTIKPVRSLYKQTLKILDKKPNRWHHCNIVQKYDLLSFENVINLSLIKMVFKCVNNLAPEIICPLISKQSSKGITTRGATNQICTVPKRKTKFAQSTFSVQGTLL